MTRAGLKTLFFLVREGFGTNESLRNKGSETPFVPSPAYNWILQPVLEIRINEILEHLLAATRIGHCFAFVEHDLFQRSEAVLAGFNLSA